MQIYPHSSPIILNDNLYEEFGGVLDTCTPRQRTNMYWLAEMTMSNALETFLLPTTVTGTCFYDHLDPFIVLDYTYVQSINHIWFYDIREHMYWSQAGTDNIYLSLRNDERGLLDLHYLVGNCCPSSISFYPYQVKISYTAGLPTGTANNPDMIMALTEYAKIAINEMIGYGNEAPGDIGVQEYRNQQYSEIRVKLLETSFGSSAKAQFINRLVEKYKRKRWVSF